MNAVLEQREAHVSNLTAGEPGSPVLELRDLHVSYGRTAALHGVNLRVMPGEVVALIGANGAGKSTTLRAISGLLKPTRGEIVFQGRSIGGLAADRVVAQGIAQSPEERHVWPAMTVDENLSMGAYLCKGKAEVQRRMGLVYERFPRLKERHRQLAGTLSGGEQQMLAIGRALMARPRMILLDEPSMGLSPLLVEQIFETIQRLNREQGLTILLVEQDVRLALRMARYAYILENGEMSLEGPSSQLMNDPAVRRAYLGV